MGVRYICFSCRGMNCISTITAVYVLFMFCYVRCFHLNNEMPDEPRQTTLYQRLCFYFFTLPAPIGEIVTGFLLNPTFFSRFLIITISFSYHFPFRLFNFFARQCISSKWFLFCSALLVLLLYAGSFLSSAFRFSFFAYDKNLTVTAYHS